MYVLSISDSCAFNWAIPNRSSCTTMRGPQLAVKYDEEDDIHFLPSAAPLTSHAGDPWCDVSG
jgi:hypothetical protein